MATRVIPAGAFGATCLALIDEIAKAGDEIVVTKRGKPVARLTADPEPEIPDLRGSILYEDEDAWKPLGVTWTAGGAENSTISAPSD